MVRGGVEREYDLALGGGDIRAMEIQGILSSGCLSREGKGPQSSM